MPHTSLTLSQAAGYLCLPAQQVKKAADRGDIPSRRFNGELLFLRDDIHRWIEQHIGDSNENELEGVESRLEQSGLTHAEVSVANLIPADGMALPLQARTRDSAIRSMVQLAMKTGLLWDAEEMTDAVKKREELHTTALDNGVALLHPRRPMPNILGDSFLTLGKLPSGIPFGGGSSSLTDIFFLICSTDDKIHLTILTRLSRILTYSDFLKQLRELDDERSVRGLIQETETAIVSS
ncbi:MAG: PTS sugar transporter subunit IIA [Planctomycetaceae bacterium]|jgi:PTS system nitrogen regulatory IIA component|nr:PTS sugar transporter subunit IIA [Planctomycetaceae bacterium]